MSDARQTRYDRRRRSCRTNSEFDSIRGEYRFFECRKTGSQTESKNRFIRFFPYRYTTRCIILYYTVLYGILRYFTVFYGILWHFTAFYGIILFKLCCTQVLQCAHLDTTLHCTAMHCTALHLHCTYTTPTIHLHYTYTTPTLHLHYTCTALITPTLHLHYTYTTTTPTLHLHHTYTTHTLHIHYTYTAPTLHLSPTPTPCM